MAPGAAPTSPTQRNRTDGQPATESPTGSSQLRYLALGDSYTIGQNVSPLERWPVQLVQRFRESDVSISDPEIIAQTGWTTAELSLGIEESGPQGAYDIVSLLIGVNNQFRGLAVGQYQVELAALLQEAVAFAAGNPSRVIVVSIPDWGVTPFASGFDRDLIAREIDLFNEINREETARVGATYINITGISREAGTDLALLADDGLHPSGEMYAQWVDIILPAAMAILTGLRD